MNEDEPRRPLSPVMIIIALGVISAMLFPFYQMFAVTEKSRRLAGQGFGFVIVVMAALALYSVARVLMAPPKD